MNTGLQFDQEMAKRMEAMYETDDMVNRRKAVVDALELQPGESVLDIGSGPGLLTLEMADPVGPTGQILGVDISECERLIFEELEKLKVEGIAGKELEKAKIQFKTDFILGRETVMDKAEAIQHYVYYHENLEDINTELENYMAVTTEDIMRVAKKYFVDTNRTVVIANPAGKESS